MVFRIAAIADIHDAADSTHPRRRKELGRLLLEQVVHTLNTTIHPDVVLVLGDLIDQPQDVDAGNRLLSIKEILAQLAAPVLVIPGNHDPAPGQFYAIFDRPPEMLEIGAVRFLAFIDEERPQYNAWRSPQNLARLQAARLGHDGPLVAFQHVPVLPPGATNCPYGYINIAAIMKEMQEEAPVLAISGHYHPGTPLIKEGGCAYLCVPALCEAPFCYTVITWRGSFTSDHLEVTVQNINPPSSSDSSHLITET
ncbi:MAG TPA: hypothetical protein GXX29_12675 [Firmicutes bacterium]|nr:hypothetical protein [Bacillota bacterium]